MKTKLEKIYDCIPAAIDRKIEAVIAKYETGEEVTDEPRVRTLDEILAPNHARFVELPSQYNSFHRSAMAAQDYERGFMQRAAMTQDLFHQQQAEGMRAMSQDEIAAFNRIQMGGQTPLGGTIMDGLFGGKWL